MTRRRRSARKRERQVSRCVSENGSATQPSKEAGGTPCEAEPRPAECLLATPHPTPGGGNSMFPPPFFAWALLVGQGRQRLLWRQNRGCLLSVLSLQFSVRKIKRVFRASLGIGICSKGVCIGGERLCHERGTQRSEGAAPALDRRDKPAATRSHTCRRAAGMTKWRFSGILLAG